MLWSWLLLSARKDYERTECVSMSLQRAGNPALCQFEFALHFFERNALRFRIEKEHHKKLNHHHQGEKRKGRAAGRSSHQRENTGDDGIHKPVREATQALALGSNTIRENLAEINPNHRSL